MSSCNDSGTFVKHIPCSVCGSSDGNALYSNGNEYCFVCEAFTTGGDSDTQEKVCKSSQRRVKGLIENLTYKELGVRGIREDTCRKYGYGLGKDKRTGQIIQVAPYYKNGVLVAQHTRTASKEFAWLGEAKSLELFGQRVWQTGGRRLVITEGEIDCLTIAQVFNLKWPVVSVPNGAQSAKKYIKQNLEFIESFDEIVISFDNDEPGLKSAKACAMLLPPGRVKIANWDPYKDPNEMLQAGQGANIATNIFQAKQFRPDGILAGKDLTLEYLQQEENILAYELPYPELTKKLRGIRKGEITTLTAGSGIGKSTVAREFAFHLLKNHKQKIGYVALEESVKKTDLGLISLELNVPMGDLFLNKKELVSDEDFEKAYTTTVANNRLFLYDHFGSLASDNLISKLRYLATGCDCDFIILDHISIVVSGIEDGDERRIIDNLMTELRSLVENTGVGMILISHLRVPEGKPHEEGGRVTLNQLRGSGSIKQLSDNIIGIERNQQGDSSDISQIRLLKNRLFGDVGLVDSIKYQKDTGRLVTYEDTDEYEDDDDEEALF